MNKVAENGVSFWKKVLNSLNENVDITPRQLSAICTLSFERVVEDIVFLSTSDEDARKLVETTVYSFVLEALKKENNSINSFVVTLSASGKKQQKPKAVEEVVEPFKNPPKFFSTTPPVDLNARDNEESNLNKSLTFENFIIGDSNKIAYASTVFVSEKPASKQYNPLYLYGSPGLGKTHLLNAVGNNIKTLFPHMKVFYTTAADYFNDFVETTVSNNQTLKKAFREKYRNVDVLLLDDVQFFSEKESTAKEFVQLFNDMVNRKKQIVVAADVSPNKLEGVHERLQQRFCSSMYCAIDAPEFEMRVAFLKNYITKGSFKYNNGEAVVFSEEHVNYIASAINSSIRELEGCINTICNQAIINNTKITEDTLDKALDAFVVASSNETNIIEILETVSAYFGVSPIDVKGKSRTPQLVKARHFTIFICRQLTNMTLVEIAKFFNRDHTAIMSAVNKITKMIKNKEDNYTAVSTLIKKIKELNKQN